MTTTGLKVEAVLDIATYEKGVKITDAQMKRLNIHREAFHPEWNYSVEPRSRSQPLLLRMSLIEA